MLSYAGRLALAIQYLLCLESQTGCRLTASSLLVSFLQACGMTDFQDTVSTDWRLQTYLQTAVEAPTTVTMTQVYECPNLPIGCGLGYS